MLQAEDERYFQEQQDGMARFAQLESSRQTPGAEGAPSTPRSHEEEEGDEGSDDEEEVDESLALAWRLQQEDDDQALLMALNGGAGTPTGVTFRNVSPSQMSFDQLTELGNHIGVVSKGTSHTFLEGLPTVAFKDVSATDAIVGEQCAICRLEFEDDDVLRILPCRHSDHAECVDKWLLMNRCCPHCQQDCGARADGEAPKAAVPAAAPAAPAAPVDPNRITEDDVEDLEALLGF
ncbi:hypothetical protein M885DRAFT_531411 [Pelagophyceae sp. CCMP2097]|nr:hypothetical protein M885DRAFT_531411 [Pelagophyceae sp. CCMP2097]